LEERRNHSRLRIENRKATLRHSNGAREVPLLDLSNGGMKIMLDDNPALGSKIIGEFRVMPQLGPYFFQGKVSWTRIIPQGNKYEVGVAFERIHTTPLK
jgi:hypothetical protein